MGASASSVEFHANVDSPSTPGQKSIVSDALDNVEPAALIEAMKQFVKDGKTKIGSESSFESKELPEGGILCTHCFEIPAIVGGGTFSSFWVHKADAANLGFSFEAYLSQTKWDRKEPNFTGTYKVLQDPVRVEFYQTFHETRMAGKMHQKFLDEVIAGIGATATTECDKPSIDDPSVLSVLSAPIEGASCDADSYFDAYKQWIVDQKGATELPDGSLIQEISWDLDFVGLSAVTYNKQIIKKEEGYMISQDYGKDESMAELKGVATVKVHKNPFRLEQWYVQTPMRQANDQAKDACTKFVMGVLETMQKKEES